MLNQERHFFCPSRDVFKGSSLIFLNSWQGYFFMISLNKQWWRGLETIKRDDYWLGPTQILRVGRPAGSAVKNGKWRHREQASLHPWRAMGTPIKGGITPDINPKKNHSVCPMKCRSVGKMAKKALHRFNKPRAIMPVAVTHFAIAWGFRFLIKPMNRKNIFRSRPQM